jgi:hypothetical protein
MATNNPRHGYERKRSQLKTKTMGQKHWTKRSRKTGEFMDQKKAGKLKSAVGKRVRNEDENTVGPLRSSHACELASAQVSSGSTNAAQQNAASDKKQDPPNSGNSRGLRRREHGCSAGIADCRSGYYGRRGRFALVHR